VGVPWPLADIPPPPPEFPLTNATVPQPVFIVVAGVCLAVVVWMLGTRLAQQRGGWSWPTLVAIGVVVLTISAAMWSHHQYREYQQRRSNWRPNGPVPERPPVSEQPFDDGDPSSDQGVPEDTAAAEDETP
jgi:hypothetical protein